MLEHHPDDPEVLSEIEKLGYDPRDVKFEGMWKHAVALFIGCGVCAAIGLATMWMFDRQQVWTHPEEAVRMTELPKQPYPLLQGNITAKTDIEDLRHEERIKTETAGWVDKKDGVARVPVAVAERLFYTQMTLEQRAKARAQAQPANAGQGGTP
ncbi:MAG TPA: hypothetical protein VNI20_13495 [Fimbriimonadaceae bacterium]|nr:hypothetical protein [Fimbriimonadaceae bacterium]